MSPETWRAGQYGGRPYSDGGIGSELALLFQQLDIKAAVEAVTEQTGGTLDYFISNAGRNHFMPTQYEDLNTAKGMFVYITSVSGYLTIPYKGTYSASKRSIEIAAETLRLELAPFGVDVLEVVTGGLPDSYLYKSIEDIIGSRAQGKEGMPRMETKDYATTVMSITATTVPQFATDSGAVVGTGLDALGS
ncbi:hypothetical protein F4810DRAFT_701184 [Camillea tinctor]|nr:hypothetical protein F4810DRAFT_701184 [Camillea tinctor]